MSINIIEHFYLFTDIETTGLNSGEDDILEVAWCLTDHDFIPIPDRTDEALVQQDDFGSTFVKLREASDVVREMHAKSGLSNDLMTAKNGFATLDSIAERMLYTARGAHIPIGSQVHLAGSSVHFDKSFLAARDEFYSIFKEGGPLHHRILDLSSIKLLWDSAVVTLPHVENENPHRAAYDVAADVQLAQAFRAQLIELERSFV